MPMMTIHRAAGDHDHVTAINSRHQTVVKSSNYNNTRLLRWRYSGALRALQYAEALACGAAVRRRQNSESQVASTGTAVLTSYS